MSSQHMEQLLELICTARVIQSPASKMQEFPDTEKADARHSEQ